MTHDNGMEMANHKWLENNTGMRIYFANPYASWERGTNENTNGLIRRFFPKKTDFSNISKEQLLRAQNMLNNRPRKVLGFMTPNEMMKIERKKIKPKNNITWCIKTDVGNFIARRKGTVFITGNCHNGHGIINTGLRTINNIIFSNATAVTDGEFSKGITYFGNIIEI